MRDGVGAEFHLGATNLSLANVPRSDNAGQSRTSATGGTYFFMMM